MNDNKKNFLLAKDIMRKNVITLPPEMTLREAAKLFLDHRITGAPVVDSNGKVVGVVSQTALIRGQKESSEVPLYYKEQEEALKTPDSHSEISGDIRIADLMMPRVIAFEENTPVHHLANEMLKGHLHRVVITHDGKLAGVVTSMDVIKAV